MAALTWRDVAAPNFSGVNQMYQGAGQSLDRALSGLSEGLKQFATTNQEEADNALLAQSMKAQDAGQMRSILAGADLSKASPKVLEAMGQRVTQLLGQASTEQGISSSKTSQAATQQNIDFGAVDQAYKVRERGNEDAARVDQAKKLGLSGAMAMLPTADQRAAATTDSNLASAVLSRQGQRISNEAGSFRNMTNKRDDASNQTAIITADNIMRRSATQDDAREELSVMQDLDPVTRAKANKILGDTFGNLYAPVGSAGGAPGKGAGGKGGDSGPAQVSSPEAQDTLALLGRNLAQRSSIGVQADVENNLNDDRSAPEVAKEIAELFPKVDHAELSGLITQKMADNPGMRAADVGSALKRSITSNWWGSTRFGDGIGVDDDIFKSNLDDMVTGRADFQSAGNRAIRAVDAEIRRADKKASDAKAELGALLQRQGTQYDISTDKASNKYAMAQAELDRVLKAARENPVLSPTYRKPPTPQERKRPERNRAGNRGER